MERFPGELYVNSAATAYFTVEQIHYKIGDYELGNDALTVISLGELNLNLVLNPFDIDIHTQYKNQEDINDVLKFFCNDGFKNYQLLSGDDKTAYDIESWTVTNKAHGGNNDEEQISITQHAKLNSKVMSYFTYCSSTIFNSDNTISTDSSMFSWVDSTEVLPTLLNNSLVYYGNMNTIAPTFQLPTDENAVELYSIDIRNHVEDNEVFNTIGTYLLKQRNNNTTFYFAPNKSSSLLSSE